MVKSNHQRVNGLALAKTWPQMRRK